MGENDHGGEPRCKLELHVLKVQGRTGNVAIIQRRDRTLFCSRRHLEGATLGLNKFEDEATGDISHETGSKNGSPNNRGCVQTREALFSLVTFLNQECQGSTGKSDAIGLSCRIQNQWKPKYHRSRQHHKSCKRDIAPGRGLE